MEPYKAVGIVTLHVERQAMDKCVEAVRLGIETSFIDATGQHRSIDPSGLQILIESVPPKIDHSLLSEPLICREGSMSRADIAERAELPIKWRISDSNGQEIAGGISYERTLTIATLAFGRYRLRIADAAGVHDEINLICVPARAFEGNFQRVWILAVQLYGIRSSRSWGIGDFTDLEWMIEWAAKAGAAGVGLNPLHALVEDRPQDCSPYSPTSRVFLNPLYVDVAQLPELGGEFAILHREAIEQARSAEFVDYVLVSNLKRRALEYAFASFGSRTTLRRKTSFEEFRGERGNVLRRFAAFEVLRRKYPGPWWEWPEEWSSPNDAALDQFRRGPNSREIEFVEFVQWCAHEQLNACTELTRRLNMPIGLYLDVAVGVKADGFDAWNEQVAISRRLSVGAPPDIINTAGQNWGLAGFNASGLETQSYGPFRDMLRASMQYAGAIRLDHVLGLKRLYLVPAGALPSGGAYVQMPFEALLALTALESVHYRCVVIGEDLGTVPEGFRDQMVDWGIWSYRVMMFERNHDGAFHPIQNYPEQAMVTFNTHDLPTFVGWLSGRDIELKQSLGIDPGESTEARIEARRLLESALDVQKLGGLDFYSALKFLAQTKSRILSISIEDLLGVVDQPNIPGTVDEHPNWRRRLSVSLDELAQEIDSVRLRDTVRRWADKQAM